MTDDARIRFFAELDRPFTGEEVFDAVAEIVYFVKDRGGRYVAVNDTLVERCGRTHKHELIGHTAAELFPEPFGEVFSDQDAQVVSDARTIEAQLELHLYPDGREGWCLTTKVPIADRAGATVGLCGISRDLDRPTALGDLDAVSKMLEHVRANLDRALPLPELARIAGLSIYRLDQRIRALFGISAGQYVIRARIDAACHRLRRTADAIADIAFDCGYSDQGAFTRQFRQTVGMPPGAYRDRMRE